MHSYLILLDGQNLTNVYDYIKKQYGTWWKHMPSSIIIKSTSNWVQIRDGITDNFKEDVKKILVVKLSGDAAWMGIVESGSLWIKNNL